MTRSEYLNSIIRTRKKVLSLNASKINVAKCLKIIKRLELQIAAYGKKWDPEGWRKFLVRNYDDIVFIIPGNTTKPIKIELLNSLI